MAKKNCPFGHAGCECSGGHYPHMCKGLTTTAFQLTHSEMVQLVERARSMGHFGTGPFKSDPQPSRLIGAIVREWLQTHQH